MSLNRRGSQFEFGMIDSISANWMKKKRYSTYPTSERTKVWRKANKL